MSTTDHDAALATVRATSVPIHDLGTAIYLSPDVMGWASEWGWTNPFAFYFAGRGGMLGDVSADVVHSAFGWFEPAAVKAMYEEGVAVKGTAGAAARMAEAHGMWGRKYLADVPDLESILAVSEELVDSLEGSGIPLFVGWRAAPRDDSPAGRAAQLRQDLREWRGGIHLVAHTSAVRGSPPWRRSSPMRGLARRSSSAGRSPFPIARRSCRSMSKPSTSPIRLQRRP